MNVAVLINQVAKKIYYTSFIKLCETSVIRNKDNTV
jgi:hypothetical protein